MRKFVRILKVPDLPVWSKGPIRALKKLIGLVVPARIIYGYNLMLEETTSRDKNAGNRYYLVPTEQFLEAVYGMENIVMEEEKSQRPETFDLSRRILSEEERRMSELPTGEQSPVLFTYLEDVLQFHAQGLAFSPGEVEEVEERTLAVEELSSKERLQDSSSR